MSVNATQNATTAERTMVSFDRFRVIAASTSCITPNRDPTPLRLLAMPPKMPRCDTSAAAVACAAPITSSTALVELCTVERSRISSSVCELSHTVGGAAPGAPRRRPSAQQRVPVAARRHRVAHAFELTRKLAEHVLCLASVQARLSARAAPGDGAGHRRVHVRQALEQALQHARLRVDAVAPSAHPRCPAKRRSGLRERAQLAVDLALELARLRGAARVWWGWGKSAARGDVGRGGTERREPRAG